MSLGDFQNLLSGFSTPDDFQLFLTASLKHPVCFLLFVLTLLFTRFCSGSRCPFTIKAVKASEDPRRLLVQTLSSYFKAGVSVQEIPSCNVCQHECVFCEKWVSSRTSCLSSEDITSQEESTFFVFGCSDETESDAVRHAESRLLESNTVTTHSLIPGQCSGGLGFQST